MGPDWIKMYGRDILLRKEQIERLLPFRWWWDTWEDAANALYTQQQQQQQILPWLAYLRQPFTSSAAITHARLWAILYHWLNEESLKPIDEGKKKQLCGNLRKILNQRSLQTWRMEVNGSQSRWERLPFSVSASNLIAAIAHRSICLWCSQDQKQSDLIQCEKQEQDPYQIFREKSFYDALYQRFQA